MTFKVPNVWRVRTGPMKSDDRSGNNGAFLIQVPNGPQLNVVASCGAGWEHVSVSTHYRTPTWDEMCFIKDIFWDSDDCVVQYHPRKADYINEHPYCLHLWRPIGKKIITPPTWMVGFKKK